MDRGRKCAGTSTYRATSNTRTGGWVSKAARFDSSTATTHQSVSDSIPPRNGWHERSTGDLDEGEGTARGCRIAVDKHFTFSFLYDSIRLTIIIFTTSHLCANGRLESTDWQPAKHHIDPILSTPNYDITTSLAAPEVASSPFGSIYRLAPPAWQHYTSNFPACELSWQ
jgi:hypothetical protein